MTSINATWIQSNLNVRATWENDGISINCIALVDGVQEHGISETAAFHVKEPPLPPINLTLEISRDQCHLTLRWNSHSNDSIISMYTIYIFWRGADTYYNTTTMEYSIKNPFSDVKFKVTAWDDVGEGTATAYLIYRPNSTGKNYYDIPMQSVVFKHNYTTMGLDEVQQPIVEQHTAAVLHFHGYDHNEVSLLVLWRGKKV